MTCALILINMVLCCGIGWTCICRFSLMSASTTKRHFRAAYSLTFTVATASGWSWLLFGEPAGVAQTLMSAAMLFGLGVGVQNWRDGPPAYARVQPRAQP